MDASDPNKDKQALYLDHIEINGIKKSNFRIKLHLKDGNVTKPIDLAEREHRWTPSHICEIPATGSISVILKAGFAVGGIRLGKQEMTMDISSQRISEAFLKVSSQSTTLGSSSAPNSNFSISEKITFDDQPATMTLEFHPSPTSESVRQALCRVNAAMEDYSQLKENKTMRSVDTALKIGAAASEANPYAKTALSLARATYDLLREQQKYDEQVSDLIARIERILPSLKEAETVSYNDADLLKTVIVQMNNLIMSTAKFAEQYVQRSFMERFAKSTISPTDRKKVDGLKTELDNIVGEFDRAMEVEVLKGTKDIETKLLLKKLKPVDAGYNCRRKCMEGTRQRLISKVVTWALEPVSEDSSQKLGSTKGILWLYGMPGIGKTSVANSICARLHAEKKLGGSFFCRRDDPKLSDPQYVLPTLTCRLAEMWGPFRKLVAQELKDDPQISPTSTGGELLTRLLKSLKNHPTYPLVLVIDALDECSDDRARDLILKKAFEATSCVPWLRVIITSRQEGDINDFFQQPGCSGRYLLEDLATDDRAHEDIRHFTRKRLSEVVAAKHLKDWAPEHLVNKVVTRASGLYIFVETLYRLVKDEADPETQLNEALEGSTGDGLGDLYSLYSGILSARVTRDRVGFKAIMGAIMVVGSYRPLCAQTVAVLLGRRASVVQTLVGVMGPLLYLDREQNNGIRFRHLSIIDFLTDSSCSEEFRVDIRQAHQEMALACLNTMIRGLKFNICGLKSSLLSNEEVKDMEVRIKENISDELEYSCMHWSSHLSFSPYPARPDMMKTLNEAFDDVRLLYWIEILSLMGRVPIGITMLREVLLWAKGSKTPFSEYVDDALRFLFGFLTPIITSTPHIYVSALPFTPMESLLWKKTSRSFQKLMRVEKGRMKRWPARTSTWSGHTSFITSLAYSPDGMRVVSGSLDDTIRIWDAKTGAPVGEPLKGHTSSVKSVAYSPDGRHIASGSSDNTIRIWDAESGTPFGEPLKGHTFQVTSVAYSPDGRHLVSGSFDKTIQIWDVKTRGPIGKSFTKLTRGINGVAYSRDGRHIASCSEGGALQIWDAETGHPVGMPTSTTTTSIAYSPDGRHLVSGSDSGIIQIWDAKTGALVARSLEGYTGAVNCVAYSPDCRHVVSGSNDGAVWMWNANTGAPVGEPLRSNNDVTSVAYSPDGRHIISGHIDAKIRIWDAETGALAGESSDEYLSYGAGNEYLPVDQQVVSGSSSNAARVKDVATRAAPGGMLTRRHVYVTSIAYSADSRRLVSGSSDNTVQIWDAETGALVLGPLEGHTDLVNSVAYSPDCRHIASGSSDGTIRIWDAEIGSPVGEPLKGHTRSVMSIAYSPDGRHIVSGSVDGTIRIWDGDTGDPVGESLKEHTYNVMSVAYSPDGQHFVSGSIDRTIRIWDAETGSPVGGPLKGHTRSVMSIAYSPDGQQIVSGSSDNTVRIWYADTGSPANGPWKGHTLCVQSVAYSPDGRHVVSGSYDQTIQIWDAKAGSPVGGPLKGHTDQVSSVAYSPDGQHFASASRDNTIRLWDANPITSAGELLKGHTGVTTNVSSSPDIRYVYDADNTIQIWSAEVPRDLIPFDLRPDSNGWIHHPDGGLLYWVPESCRNGLMCPAILTIPTDGWNRVVRLDPSGACFGASWEQIKSDAQT